MEGLDSTEKPRVPDDIPIAPVGDASCSRYLLKSPQQMSAMQLYQLSASGLPSVEARLLSPATGQPSPVPSNDSDSSVGSNSSEASFLDLFTVTVDEGVGAGGVRRVVAGSERYATIDLRKLQLIHLGNGTIKAKAKEETGTGECDNESLDFETTSSSSITSRGPSRNDASAPFATPFHSYAQKPEEGLGESYGKEGKGRGGGGGKRGEKVEANITLKKKEQNKTAAQRYRMKKKMESGSVELEEREEERRNKELKSKVNALETEIKYLKNLMTEFQRHRTNQPQPKSRLCKHRFP